MLILNRKPGQAILIGNDIEIIIVGSLGPVRIGVNAPQNMRIIRHELIGLNRFQHRANHHSVLLNNPNNLQF